MKNVLFGILAVACIFACGQAVGAETSAKIVDEKAIFALGDDVNRGENGGVGSMRLSPDGTKLLFIRRVGEDRKTRSYQLALHDIKTGKEKELELPGYDTDDLAEFMVSGNVFGPAGRKVALGVGIDANKNGRHDWQRGSEQMQAVVYDLATDKMTKIGETSDVALASFDRTGKGMVIINAEKKAMTGKMFVTPLEKVKLRQLCLWGLPRGGCPTADVMAVLLPPEAGQRADGKRPASKMVLLDLAKDKVLADLPLHESNTMLNDYCPQWTGDGRYLYYTSEAHEPEANGHIRSKTESRVWDRKKKQLAYEVPATIPIGPGPTATTMVLCPYPVTPGAKPIVHDAKADTTWAVDGPAIRMIASQGKYILYSKKGDGGKETLYRGKISLSTK
jgi:hypothetical protein